MSRTDKDAPYWVRDPWESVHHPGCGRRYACDLPAWTGVYYPRLSAWRRGPRPRCYWTATYASRTRNGGQGSAPGWYINHVWNAPQRRLTRDLCRRAAAEYRAGADDLTEPPTDQHRRCADWL